MIDGVQKHPDAVLRNPAVVVALITGVFGVLVAIVTGILAHIGQLPGQAIVTTATTATVTTTVTAPAAPQISSDSSRGLESQTTTPGSHVQIGQVLISRSQILIPDNTVLDFDPGAENWPVGKRNAPGIDVYVYRGIGTLNQSQIGFFASKPPSYSDCVQFTGYSMNHIEAARVKGGNYFCVQTSDERAGFFKIESLSGSDLIISAAVWAKSTDAG